MPFVTFEGVEGSGKSTQLKLAAARLRARGRPVLATREPGGTRIGRILRGALLPSAHRELDSVAEWLLFEADRRQHVVEVLRPALEKGRFVLCDRFSDATEAYQLDLLGELCERFVFVHDGRASELADFPSLLGDPAVRAYLAGAVAPAPTGTA